MPGKEYWQIDSAKLARDILDLTGTAKTLLTVKQVLKDKVPIFTCQYGPDKEADVNKDLFALGIPSYPRKTVGDYLESLGARTDVPPPFPPKPDDSPDSSKDPATPNTKPRQISFL